MNEDPRHESSGRSLLDPVRLFREIRGRRVVAGVQTLCVVSFLAYSAWVFLPRDHSEATAAAGTPSKQVGTRGTADPPAATASRHAADSGKPSDQALLKLREVLKGEISPKSVAASGSGYVTAQNMMYRHSITVYDANSLKVVKTIPDSVDLAKFGYPKYGRVQGAPVEAAFSSDGRYAYVSNYSMYGAGFGREGSDSCTPSSGTDPSFLYRIDMKRLEIDRAYRVGSVPKVVAVTPDDSFVLVSNWCSWDLSVVSTQDGREVKRIPIGPYPRGIAVAPDGSSAYVAVMGGNELVRIDLKTWQSSRLGVGSGPRAVKIEPEGRYAFVSLNAEGRVAKLDLSTGAVKAKVSTGQAPRSLELAADGKALFVVNYESGTVTKLRTSDMSTLQTINACPQPIGITYDRVMNRVWVACYGGSIRVYNDR